MVAYLDSSVLLQHVLRGDLKIATVFDQDSVVSSELLEIECMRVIHRYRLNGDLDDNHFVEAQHRIQRVLDGVSLIGLSSAVKKRATESFPTVIKTLDALHLSTAIIFQERQPGTQLCIYSFDRAFNRCAQALGFETGFDSPSR